jgi:virulence-associated protein VapD
VEEICSVSMTKRNLDVKSVMGLNSAKLLIVRHGELKNTMGIVYPVVFITALKSKYRVISKRKRMTWFNVFLKNIQILIGLQIRRYKMVVPKDDPICF